jgi:alpha-beta hydrolase superfamily lysophospholipase
MNVRRKGSAAAACVAAFLFLAVAAGGCAPFINIPGQAVGEPALDADGFHAADGVVLPVRAWLPEGMPVKAAVVALHGFNDYSSFFVSPALYLAENGVASYAYDQRGFGAAPGRGLWAGTGAMAADLKAFARLVRARHPGVPIYLLGASMGGAVVMVAAAEPDPPAADGVILAAPAVWGRATMPWYQRFVLWVGAHTLPSAEITGRSLKIMPSDNIEMLRALGADPLVGKATRIDTLWGLVNLMDRALDSAARLTMPTLILYGEKDEIIPRRPTRAMLARLPQAAAERRRVALYPKGYHMLLRDVGGETAWKDIRAWMTAPAKPLPSGADRQVKSWLSAKDGD